MRDPWNPTPDEVRAWAYTPDALEPCEDWHLALVWSRPEKALLEIASDESCPARHYVLSVLYLIVGDAVRSDFRTTARPIVEGFIARGDGYNHADIRRCQVRSRELLANPDSFDYDLWCGGGYSRATEA